MEMEKATVSDIGGRTHPRGTVRNPAYEFGEDRATADQARSPPCMLELPHRRSPLRRSGTNGSSSSVPSGERHVR